MAANEDGGSGDAQVARAFMRSENLALGMVTVSPVATGGVFVPHPSPGLSVGAKIVLSFPLPAGQQHDVQGVVAHVVSRAEARRTMSAAGYVLTLQGGAATAQTPPPAASPPPGAAAVGPPIPPQQPDQSAGRATLPAPEDRPRIVLVVEDDRVLAKLIECWMTKIGMVSVCVSSGKEALKIAKNRQTLIDIAIVDALLPDTSSMKLIPKLRAVRSIPIIATSGILVRADSRSQVMQAGATRFFAKPLDENGICRAVKELTVRAAKKAQSGAGGAYEPGMRRSA